MYTHRVCFSNLAVVFQMPDLKSRLFAPCLMKYLSPRNKFVSYRTSIGLTCDFVFQNSAGGGGGYSGGAGGPAMGYSGGGGCFLKFTGGKQEL